MSFSAMKMKIIKFSTQFADVDILVVGFDAVVKVPVVVVNESVLLVEVVTVIWEPDPME